MKKQIPFDLDKALAGAQVQYRNGENLTRDDWHWFKNSNAPFAIHTVYKTYAKNGRLNGIGADSFQDLMLEVEVEKVKGWVNVYPDYNYKFVYNYKTYKTEEEAFNDSGLYCTAQVFVNDEVKK